MTSFAPGQVATPQQLVTPQRLSAATDTELAHTAAAVLAEQHRRALADKDLTATIEEAFLRGFGTTGTPNIPWVGGGLLYCPGYIRHKSATSHECSFITVDGTWAWDSDARIEDIMRQVPGPKVVKQSITVITPREGMEIDVVISAAKSGGGCQMKKVTSYQIRVGELVQVATRSKTLRHHTRT